MGHIAKAKDELALCGQPGGFTTGISYGAESPSEKAIVEALQQSLVPAAIKLEIKPYPGADYSGYTPASRTSRSPTVSV